jgi:hypothetical protein
MVSFDPHGVGGGDRSSMSAPMNVRLRMASRLTGLYSGGHRFGLHRSPLKRRVVRPVTSVGLVLAFALMVGCGADPNRPETFPVRGQLFVNGRPAEGARVVLHPKNGESFDQRGSRPQGTVGADGSFELTTYGEADGAPEGTYEVSIFWLANPDAVNPGPDRLGGRFSVPGESGITVEVGPGENELDPIRLDGVQLRDAPSAPASGREPGG